MSHLVIRSLPPSPAVEEVTTVSFVHVIKLELAGSDLDESQIREGITRKASYV